MNETIPNSDIIRGSIDTIILSVLIENDNYGYKIIKRIYEKSGNIYELKEPTLYSSLKRLEAQKMIKSYWGEETQGGRRKYYSITDEGRMMYQSGYKEWKSARDIIDRLVIVKKEGDGL